MEELLRSRTLEDDFSLEPIGEIVLGPRRIPVPPLTRGRFLKLLSFPQDELRRRVVQAVTDAKTSDPLQEGRAAAEALAPVVLAMVPGLTREAWEERGTLWYVLELMLIFKHGHDWQMIGNSIEAGIIAAEEEGRSDPVSEESALQLYTKLFGGTIPELQATRIEGFWRLMNGALEGLDRENAARRMRTAAGGGDDGEEIPVDATLGSFGDVPVVRDRREHERMDALLDDVKTRPYAPPGAA